jgi:hypothetical protein
MGTTKALFLLLILILEIRHGRARKCERISLQMCQDIGYNLTVMPNFMGHEDQLTANRAVIIFALRLSDLELKFIISVCVIKYV